jgi:transposase
MTVYSLGNPLNFIITGGEKADCTMAIELIENLEFESLIADKGYDTNAIVEAVESKLSTVIIPPKKNRKVQREYDKEYYKERHKVECQFGFLKHYRRIFSRFDKLKSRFLSFLHFVGVLRWLK